MNKQNELARIAEQLSSEGWRVTTGTEVSELLPASLTFKPDIVAFRGKDKLIGEVIRRGSRHGMSSANIMAQISSTLPDWQVRVFYIDDKIPVPEKSDIESVIQPVGQLSEISTAAAFIQAWIGLEMALRRLEARYATWRDHRKIPSAAELNSLGAISDRVYERLTHFQRIRNGVIHGQTLEAITHAEIEELVEIVESISSDGYMSPDEVVEWFRRSYNPVKIEEIDDPVARSSLLASAEAIQDELRRRLASIGTIDSREVAEILVDLSETWLPATETTAE